MTRKQLISSTNFGSLSHGEGWGEAVYCSIVFPACCQALNPLSNSKT